MVHAVHEQQGAHESGPDDDDNIEQDGKDGGSMAMMMINHDDSRDNVTAGSMQGAASSTDTAMYDDASPLLSACTSLSGHDLTDLSGTTAARSRKMSDEERKIMLHKRRLRNRASAARSREKRSRTLNELTTEVEDLMKNSARLAEKASQALGETRKLRAKNLMLMKENELLKAELKL